MTTVQIVGIAGLMGAGRTELAMSVFGRAYGRNVRGEATMEGKPVDLSSIQKAVASGIVSDPHPDPLPSGEGEAKPRVRGK